jgi:hypothetical protein
MRNRVRRLSHSLRWIRDLLTERKDMKTELKTKAEDQPKRPEAWAWAEREVTRQGAPGLAPQFIQAWDYSRNNFFMSDHMDLERQIVYVNMMVTDEWDNSKRDLRHQGYRTTPVVFSNGNDGADWREIPRLVNQLCKSHLFWDGRIEEFCIEFLRIHPFADGNGRTAAILLNRRTHHRDFICVPTVDGWIEDAKV